MGVDAFEKGAAIVDEELFVANLCLAEAVFSGKG